MLYLCTRNQEVIITESKVLGALVQLVRIRACHARGQGFESPTHRTKEDNRKVVFFFVSIQHDDSTNISKICSYERDKSPADNPRICL